MLCYITIKAMTYFLMIQTTKTPPMLLGFIFSIALKMTKINEKDNSLGKLARAK